MRSWLAIIPLVGLVGLVGVALSRLTATNPGPAAFSSPQRLAPAIQANDLSGAPIFLSSVKGPYIVNVWATWCTPCRAEHPVLMRLREEGATLVGVLHMDSNDKADPAAAIGRAQTLLARDGDPFTMHAADPKGDVSLAFGIAGVPESFLVDASGMIVKTIRGPLIGTDGEAFLAAYRAELARSGGPGSQLSP